MSPIYHGYTHLPCPSGLWLGAWVYAHGRNYQAEILSVQTASRQVEVIEIGGHRLAEDLPFTALQSVALYDGLQVVQAFGHPFQTTPTWVSQIEVP